MLLRGGEPLLCASTSEGSLFRGAEEGGRGREYEMLHGMSISKNPTCGPGRNTTQHARFSPGVRVPLEGETSITEELVGIG